MRKTLIYNILCTLILVASPVAIAEDADPESEAPAAALPPLQEDLGYFFGYSFGNMLKDGGSADVDIDRLVDGLRHSLGNVPPALDLQQRERVFEEIRTRQAKAQEARELARLAEEEQAAQLVERNLASAIAFLQQNAQRPEVRTTASGLQYEILSEGDGSAPAASDRVVVHYEGRFVDGEVFDKSADEPAEFGLNQVILGWSEGLQLMKAGSKYRFFIHPELAYGAGSVGRIPPNSLLIFDVELIEVESPGAAD